MELTASNDSNDNGVNHVDKFEAFVACEQIP
jgi:hypothetical protein